MDLLPYDSETLVSVLSKEEVLSYLNRVTREVNFLDRRTQTDKSVVFNGMIGNSGFQISKVVSHGDTFLPMILGKVEQTARGSIIFLNYKLFSATLFFLVFWSIVLCAFTALYLFVIPNYLYAAICFGLGIFNYLIAMYFFHRQVKASREVFHQLINFQMKD